MKTFFFIICILFLQNIYTQNLPIRSIFLLHGLNGSATHWNVYKPYLDSLLKNKKGVYTINYNSNIGVNNATQEALKQMNYYKNSQNIAIGQSMGGVVLSEVDRINTNTYFGGFITMGSPNNGGAILNDLKNGSDIPDLIKGITFNNFEYKSNTYNLIKEGCNLGSKATINALAAGANSLTGGNLLLKKWFVTALPVSNAISSIFCEFILPKIILEQKSPFKNATQTANDLSVNSAILSNINNTNTETPKIAIYGHEQSPVHWRVLGNYFYDYPWDLERDKTSDENLVNLINDINNITAITENVLNAAGVVYSGLAISAIWWCLPCIPRFVSTAGLNFYAASTCLDFERWISSSEAKWHQIIGAGGYYTQQRNVPQITADCQAQIDAFFDFYDDKYKNPNLSKINWGNYYNLIQNPSCYSNITTTVYYPINYESDGLFNAGTQRLPEDPSDFEYVFDKSGNYIFIQKNNSHVVNLKADKVNHAEFLNHPEIRKKLIQIFQGQNNVNNFFKNTLNQTYNY